MKTISLELALRLHELGLRGESEYTYYRGEKLVSHKLAAASVYMDKPHIPAWMFHEIWAMLPCEILHNKKRLAIDLFKHPNGTTEAGYLDDQYQYDWSFMNCSPTEAAGLLLEWAIKEGHVERE
jgi:hypothetical protein